MLIPLGTGDWESSVEDIRRIRLHNMYMTEDPRSPDGFCRVSRPTLTPFITIGSGPIYGIWQEAGAIGGVWLVVSGQELYKFEHPSTVTLIDDLPGEGFCQFAATTDRVLIIRDGILYTTDGDTLGTVSTPDDVLIGGLASIDNFFIMSVLNSQRFYWLEPGQTDIDALNFASAERLPDPIESVAVAADEIYFIGRLGPEVWTVTGDADIPFQRITGRVYNEGCASGDTVVTTTVKGIPALIWVTDVRTVVLAQGVPSTISNKSIEELLKKATTLRAWSFRYNRHSFYVLTYDQQTLVYDIDYDRWLRWDSYLMDNWRAHLGIQENASVYSGDSVTNQIWILDEGVSDDGAPVIRELSGSIDCTGTPFQCNKITIRVNAGWSPSYDLEPLLSLRWSDDQGVTWSQYRTISLGNAGHYDKVTWIRSLGLIRIPGRTYEFRFSDPARFRLDYATINEDD